MSRIASLMVALLLCSPLAAQVTAKIDGPTETEPGNLVVLSVGDSKADVFKWVLIGAPPSSFAPFDGGRSCVFARGIPGEYRFVLIAGGAGTDGKLAVAVAEKTLVVRGALPPPNPTPGPGPTPTPGPVTNGRKTAVILRETADQTPEMARMVVALRTGPTQSYLSSKGHQLLILDKDSKDENGQTPETLAKVQQATAGKPLPQLVILDQATGAVQSVEPLGSNPDFVVELIKRTGG